jgi:hypothetical protein
MANFSSYQRGVYCVSIRFFNTLSASIAELVKDKKHFISALKRFITAESFYSINKYLNYQHEIKIDDSSIWKALQTLYTLSTCSDIGLVIVLYNHVFIAI